MSEIWVEYLSDRFFDLKSRGWTVEIVVGDMCKLINNV